MGTRRAVGRDWVLLDWASGAVQCPYHGILDMAQEYTPGPAVCGCTFVQGLGGLLRAVKAASDVAEKSHQVTSETANNGPQCCGHLAQTAGNRNPAQ